MNALGNLTKDVSGLWMGTIVSFDDQKEQVFGLGWGWRYKIRKIGQDSNDDQIPDANLTYALCLLGPSDGTGGGGRSRSVRYSQGDIVVGFQFQNTPIIFGALGRTSAIKYGQSGKFAPKSGFTQTIQPGLTERQEFTGSGGGPPTPQLRPQNKKENQQREKPSDALRKMGEDPDSPAKTDAIKEAQQPTPVATNEFGQPLDPKVSGKWDGSDGNISKEDFKNVLSSNSAATTNSVKLDAARAAKNSGVITQDQYRQYTKDIQSGSNFKTDANFQKL